MRCGEGARRTNKKGISSWREFCEDSGSLGVPVTSGPSQAESLVVKSLAPAYQLRVVTLDAKSAAPLAGDTEFIRFVGGRV